nr:MAG: toxin RelE [actinobacterium acMicro-1]
MTFRLRFTPAVNKQISKLDKPVAARIKRYLVNLDLTNPRSTGKPLAGDTALWRYRVGDYRILASISDEEVLVLVVDIDHRSRVYRQK